MEGILKPNKWFFTQVFLQNVPRSRSDVPDVAEGILKFFPGFNAFALSPPSTDPNVLNNPNTKKDQLQPQFLSELEQFKKMIKSMLVPKHSCNKGELITGEGTCSCCCFQTRTKSENWPPFVVCKLKRYSGKYDFLDLFLQRSFKITQKIQLTGERYLTNYYLQMQNITLSCWNFYATLTGVSLWCVCLYSNAAFDNTFYPFDLCS